MAKHRYLTADQLGISDEALAGLKRLQKELQDGTLIRVPPSTPPVGPRSKLNGRMFNMERWGDKTSCGTVHCIGGFLEVRGQLRNRDQEKLRALFFPPTTYSFKKITTKQAAKAIENYRRELAPQWERVLKRNG